MHLRLFDCNSNLLLFSLTLCTMGKITHGGKGRNLPCDLHNEHVNRL